jgi:hypothetical protein
MAGFHRGFFQKESNGPTDQHVFAFSAFVLPVSVSITIYETEGGEVLKFLILLIL